MEARILSFYRKLGDKGPIIPDYYISKEWLSGALERHFCVVGDIFTSEETGRINNCKPFIVQVAFFCICI